MVKVDFIAVEFPEIEYEKVEDKFRAYEERRRLLSDFAGFIYATVAKINEELKRKGAFTSSELLARVKEAVEAKAKELGAKRIAIVENADIEKVDTDDMKDFARDALGMRGDIVCYGWGHFDRASDPHLHDEGDDEIKLLMAREIVEDVCGAVREAERGRCMQILHKILVHGRGFEELSRLPEDSRMAVKEKLKELVI